jgi:hypothetical protein
MPKSLTSLNAHTDDILDGRRRTKDARFKPLPQGVEHVSSVLEHAIEFLQTHLSERGFRAAPSQLSLSRKVGDLTQVVRLRPSGSNLSGVSAEVTAEALVKSSSLKRWTKNEGSKYPRELFWVRQLGYLGGGNQYFKWQLVDPGTREAELRDLLQKVQTLALPALEAWGTKESIPSAVFRFTEVERIDWLVEAALWAGSTDAARQLISRHFGGNPKDHSAFRSELARFRAAPEITEPLPQALSSLAFLAARHGLVGGGDG